MNLLWVELFIQFPLLKTSIDIDKSRDALKQSQRVHQTLNKE